MNQETQKKVIRIVAVFAAVFGLVFFFLQRGSGVYETKTRFIVLPQNELMTGQIGLVSENIEVMLNSEIFREKISGVLYAKTEEWKKFSFEVRNVGGSVFEITYSDDARDPYATREMMGAIEEQITSLLSQNYDLTQDIRVNFLEGGNIVVQTNRFWGDIFYAFIFSVLAVAAMEGFFVWRKKRMETWNSDSAMRERINSTIELDAWKEKFQRKVSAEDVSEESFVPLSSSLEGIPEMKNASDFFVRNESEISSVIPESGRKIEGEGAPFEGKPKKIEETNSASSVLSEPGVFCPSAVMTGSAPMNLPVSEDIPDILKPPKRVSASTVAESSRVEDPENIVIETPVKESPMNPEPTIEELKERLNKLLRGEL